MTIQPSQVPTPPGEGDLTPTVALASRMAAVKTNLSAGLKKAVSAVQTAVTPETVAQLSSAVADDALRKAGTASTGQARSQFAALAAENLATWEAAKIKAEAPAAQAAAYQVKSAAMAFAAGLAVIERPEIQDACYNALSRVRTKIFRARTGTQYLYDTLDTPPTYIEVAQMPASAKSASDYVTNRAVGNFKYNDFFITDTQEMDAEKADVSETFGAPHVFATGRYMRKLTITGVCRTGPVNHGAINTEAFRSVANEGDRNKLLVSQMLGLRVLYDQMLRASEQISRGLYSRLHVDGEVYCGWFTTLNISRSGNDEGFAHFTSSMLVFQRYHADEAIARSLLVPASVPPRAAFDDTTAVATLASLAGELKISFTSATASVRDPVAEQKTDALQFGQSTQIKLVGVSQRLAVKYTVGTTPITGFSLTYAATGKPTLEDVPPAAGIYDVFPSVTDFNAFVESLKQAGALKEFKPTPVTITVEVRPAFAGTSTTLAVGMTVNPLRTPTVDGVVVTLMPTLKDVTMPATVKPSEFFADSATSVPLRLRMNVKDASGSGLPANVLQGITAVPWDVEKKAKAPEASATISATTGTVPSTMEADKTKVARPKMAVVIPTAFVEQGQDGAGGVETTVTLDMSALSLASNVCNLQTTNPFAGANELRVTFGLQLTFKDGSGYGPVIVPATFAFHVTYAKNTSWTYLLLGPITQVKLVLRAPTAGGSWTATIPLNRRVNTLPATPDEVLSTVNEILKSSSVTFYWDTGIRSGETTVPSLFRHASINGDVVTATFATANLGVRKLQINIPPAFGVIPLYDSAVR